MTTCKCLLFHVTRTCIIHRDIIGSDAQLSSSEATEYPELALVIDGSTLEHIWKSPDLKYNFSSIIPEIPTVIACRVSPLQVTKFNDEMISYYFYFLLLNLESIVGSNDNNVDNT